MRQSGEGRLDAKELDALFNMMGAPLEPHMKAQMMAALDADGAAAG